MKNTEPTQAKNIDIQKESKIHKIMQTLRTWPFDRVSFLLDALKDVPKVEESYGETPNPVPLPQPSPNRSGMENVESQAKNIDIQKEIEIRKLAIFLRTYMSTEFITSLRQECDRRHRRSA